MATIQNVDKILINYIQCGGWAFGCWRGIWERVVSSKLQDKMTSQAVAIFDRRFLTTRPLLFIYSPLPPLIFFWPPLPPLPSPGPQFNYSKKIFYVGCFEATTILANAVRANYVWPSARLGIVAPLSPIIVLIVVRHAHRKKFLASV